MKMLVTKLSKGKYANEGQIFVEPISDSNVKLMGEMIAMQALRNVIPYDFEAAGTTTDGTILRYYRCPYSKKDPNCHNQSVRKVVLEQIVVDALTNEIAKPENIALITNKVFELYCAKFAGDSDLRRYEKELAATDKAIKNILAAIEEGIFTPSTKQRLTELEEKKTRIEQAITVESAQEKNMLTKDDIERYITDAIKLSAKQMVELLVERIDVYADKICIKLKYSDTPIEPPTDFSDHAQTDNLSKFFGNTDNNADCACDATQSPQTDKHHNGLYIDKSHNVWLYIVLDIIRTFDLSIVDIINAAYAAIVVYTDINCSARSIDKGYDFLV